MPTEVVVIEVILDVVICQHCGTRFAVPQKVYPRECPRGCHSKRDRKWLANSCEEKRKEVNRLRSQVRRLLKKLEE